MTGRTVKVAVAQMAPRMLDRAANLEMSLKLAGRAAGRGAAVVVLPELCNSGYDFKDMAEVRRAAEPVPGGETVQQWARFSQESDIYIVGGLCERLGKDFYNSAAVTGPEGFIGVYRKIHLWDKEPRWFKPGLRTSVFPTRVGVIGVMICYDTYFFEAVRSTAAKGAELICQPMATDDEFDMTINRVRSMEHSLPIATANIVGKSRFTAFVGMSQVTAPDGIVLVKAGSSKEQVLVAEIDLSGAKGPSRPLPRGLGD